MIQVCGCRFVLTHVHFEVFVDASLPSVSVDIVHGFFILLGSSMCFDVEIWIENYIAAVILFLEPTS